MNYKTPGVFIEEISTFPPSVVAVQTAIPAFIGYTQQAVDPNGNSLSGIPVRITSLLEYHSLFGGPFETDNFLVTVSGSGLTTVIEDVTPRDDADTSRRFYLYDSVELFYQNGGGPCYIVSVGSYADDIDDADIETGLNEVARFDEPTLLLFPDAVGLRDGDNPDLVNFGRLQQLALAQCEKLKDRFVIMDVLEGFLENAFPNTPIDDFRNNIGTNALNYGAAYYPWVYSAKEAKFSFRKLNFQDDTPTALSYEDLDTLLGAADVNSLLTTLLGKQSDTNEVIDTLSGVIAGIDADSFSPLRDHYKALLDVFYGGANSTRAQFTAVFEFLRAVANAFPALAGASLSANSAVAARITVLQTEAALIAALRDLISIEKNAAIQSDLMTQPPDDPAVEYAALETDWTDGDTIAAIPVDTDIVLGAGTIRERGTVVFEHVKYVGVVDKLLATLDSLFNLALSDEQKAESALFAASPFFKSLAERIRNHIRMVPPSGAVAGIYAAVDRTRGVWKAPANVSLNAVIGPVVKITSQEQADLNVTASGKSVNAIRSFTGKGTLIWGSRTLAGNDNEWRYVPVRRFFNMAEESIKKATEQFVFEPNDANTWVKVRGMIENFLVVQWRQGALAGATPADAFFVKIGLGQTMTAQDILEGRMIVEIGMAVVRPAEFIILRFMHKMQEA
jgi:uncharacterized protein